MALGTPVDDAARDDAGATADADGRCLWNGLVGPTTETPKTNAKMEGGDASAEKGTGVEKGPVPVPAKGAGGAAAAARGLDGASTR